jgi:uncharacterized membrane protein HdeD (DUF308 family)
MTSPLGAPLGFLTAHRTEVVAVAVVGLVLGIVALVWPGATLLTVAVLFGIYLLVSGLFRITTALLVGPAAGGHRWLGGVIGVLIVIAGVYCLVNPAGSLAALVFVIGFGWVAEGVVDIMAGIQGIVSPGWLGIVSGIVSIIAGVIAFTLPGLAATTFLTIGAVLLIAVSVTTLLTLPRKNTVAA